MKKINLEKCEDLSDVFCAMMGGRPDSIEEIESFMKTSLLSKIIYPADLNRIINFDGFFADEIVDAVYALIPAKISLNETRSLVVTPQAFRKLNNARVSRPASRLINIGFPKAVSVYNAFYENKIQELIQVVHEIQQKKNTKMDEQTSLRVNSNTTEKTETRPITETTKSAPPIVIARQQQVAEQRKKEKTTSVSSKPKKYFTKKDVAEKSIEERVAARKAKINEYQRNYKAKKKLEKPQLSEEELQIKKEQQRLKREKLKAERAAQKAAEKEQKRIQREQEKEQEKLRREAEKKQRKIDRKRFKKQEKDLIKACQEKELLQQQKEILKQQQNKEKERLIKEEQKRNKKAKKRREQNAQKRREKIAETNPEEAAKREKNRLQMQKRRAKNPNARKSYYVKYDDLSEEERERKRQANRERNRRYREAHRLELRKSHNERRAKLKAENPELLKAMDKANNEKANRKEIGQRYYQNHKEEINKKAQENPMVKIYKQRYEEKKKQAQNPSTLISPLLMSDWKDKGR